jgi:hypothetical protein
VAQLPQVTEFLQATSLSVCFNAKRWNPPLNDFGPYTKMPLQKLLRDGGIFFFPIKPTTVGAELSAF